MDEDFEEFSLKFAPQAERDLDAIYTYISDNLSAHYAAKSLMDKFDEGFNNLKLFPLGCPLILDDHLRQRGYRKLIVNNYIAFYIANEDLRQVEVMRVLYGASDYVKYL